MRFGFLYLTLTLDIILMRALTVSHMALSTLVMFGEC